MSKLKGVILSIEDTILPQQGFDKAIFGEVTRLINYFRSKNIEFVIFTNRIWTVGKEDPLEDKLKKHWGSFTYICGANDPNVPSKPRASATKYVLDRMKWDSTETVYIGASDSDMRTAVNGQLLFLRATWWANNTDYGFEFDSPKDIARYIDTFCLRDHFWCHEIHDGDFNFYALAPFSTMKPEYTLYSEDARSAAKRGTGHPNFWLGALVSSLYFCGIHKKIDYVSVYPGHQAGSGNVVMNDAISIFGKCFRKNYIPDLIIRHTTSTKSQTARNTGVPIDHLNQLNTIHINRTPLRTATVRYTKSPLQKGKTVLLIDDIATRGYSFESARAYLEQAGVKVISAAWLKTINTDISQLAPLGKFNPYTPNTFSSAPVLKQYDYRGNIVDSLAPSELSKVFSNYEKWDWPVGI
tara:strand:- start:39172 stop:40404 length:1233 start_codon:yes stop_codon:yes gene_type:complete